MLNLEVLACGALVTSLMRFLCILVLILLDKNTALTATQLNKRHKMLLIYFDGVIMSHMLSKAMVNEAGLYILYK